MPHRGPDTGARVRRRGEGPWGWEVLPADFEFASQMITIVCPGVTIRGYNMKDPEYNTKARPAIEEYFESEYGFEGLKFRRCDEVTMSGGNGKMRVYHFQVVRR